MLEPREVARYAGFIGAMMAKAKSGDPETFAQVVTIIDGARDTLPDVCAAMRRNSQDDANGVPGYSWADIGRALGVSRSAAQQRFALR